VDKVDDSQTRTEGLRGHCCDSQSDACTGILPYGVEGEIAASLETSKELRKRFSKCNARYKQICHSDKCFDSSKAIFVKSEKKCMWEVRMTWPKSGP